MQQTAVFKVFQGRLDNGLKDWACYADPGARKVYTIRECEQKLVSTEQMTQTVITLDDVLDIFGLEKRESNSPLLLWSHIEPDLLPSKKHFRDLTLFWNTKKRRVLLEWVMEKKGDEPTVLKGLKHGYADYFEQVVQYEVAKILSVDAPGHHVNEAWANVRVKDSQGKEIAEWDIVLVTDFGTLIILDAKTGIFHSKDEHARLFNLERATGFYGQFWLIIPYLFEDMKDNGFYAQKGAKGKEYRSIPFALNELNSKVLAINNLEKSLYLAKIKKKKIQYYLSEKKPDSMEETLEISNLNTLLEKLRLGRS